MGSHEAMGRPPYARLVLDTATKRVGLRAHAARQLAPELPIEPDPLTATLVWRNAANLLLLATTPVHQRVDGRAVLTRQLTIPLEDETGSIRIESSDIGVPDATGTGEIRLSYIHNPTYANRNLSGRERTVPLFSLHANQPLPNDELEAINYFIELARIHAPQQVLKDTWRDASRSLVEFGTKIRSGAEEEAGVAEFTTNYIPNFEKSFSHLQLHGVLTPPRQGEDATGQITVEEIKIGPVETKTPLFTLSTTPTEVELSFPDQADEPQTEEETWKRINTARHAVGIIVSYLNSS
jgi:hypothetical protein